MDKIQKEADRELTLIQLGYNSAMKDIFEKINQATELKNEIRPIDMSTKLIMENAISKAFFELNATFYDKTLLIYTKIL